MFAILRETTHNGTTKFMSSHVLDNISLWKLFLWDGVDMLPVFPSAKMTPVDPVWCVLDVFNWN